MVIGYSTLYAQTCGTEVTPKQIQYLDKTKTQRQNYSVFNNLNARMPINRVPVKIHIVRTSAGTGGLTTAQIATVINDMNVFYANSNMEFFECGAINYIDDDTYYNYDAASENALAVPNDVSNVINIYFLNSITSGGSALCGYTRLPPSVDRIFMANSCATNGSTMSHEMGHYFSLYHTHGKTNTGTTDELVDGTNCTTAGDDVCDTPADPNLSGLVSTACIYTGNATDGNGDTYVPNPNNLMSYARKACRTMMTAGQYNRIAFSLANDRNYLACSSVAASSYCASGANNSADSYISSVQLNTINRSSSGSCATYTDYTATDSTDLVPGQSYSLSITTGDCDGGAGFNHQTKVYIDWNNDGDFGDNGEEVFAQPYGVATTINTNITVPSGATAGSTQMRIVCAEGASTIVAPCGTYAYGETEDYRIVITGSGSIPTSSACNGSLTCASTINTFPYNQDFEGEIQGSTSCGASYTMLSSGWQNINGAGGGSESVGPTANTIGTGGTYTVLTAGLVFDVTSPVTLDGVHVYPNSSGNVTIRLLNSSNTVLNTVTTTVNTPNVKTFVALGFAIPVGTGYKLDMVGSASSGFYRNSSGASYPYTSASGAVSITGAINGLTSYYYFFYDWQISTCGDDIDWISDAGGTGSLNTGPSADYNPGTGTGKYMYTEASCSGTGYPNMEAILQGPCFDLSAISNTEIEFAYHMYGTNMGDMFLEVNSGSSWVQVWTMSGDQGNTWQTATVDLSAYDGSTIGIRFRGVTGSSFRSDMAIDDISVRSNWFYS